MQNRFDSRVDWFNNERKIKGFNSSRNTSFGSAVIKTFLILIAIAGMGISGLWIGAGFAPEKTIIVEKETVSNLNTASLINVDKNEIIALFEDGETYFKNTGHPKIFEAFGDSGIEPMLAFDAYVSEFIKNSNHPIVAAIADPDIYPEKLIELFQLCEYMEGVTKGSLGFETILIQAASLIHYSESYQLPLGLTVGVAQTESTFRPNAASSAGAVGPMQVMWPMHAGLLSTIGITTREQLMTPDNGIHAGCMLLSRYLKAEQSVTSGLKRYYGALSTKYVGSVYSHRHSWELFSTGISRNWASTLETEKVNWTKISGGIEPKRNSTSSGARTSSSSSTGTVKTSASRGSSTPSTPQKPLPGTVYRGGSITIDYGDGNVKTWKGESSK